LAFGIVTPHTVQRATLQKDRRADPGPIASREVHDVKNDAFCHNPIITVKLGCRKKLFDRHHVAAGLLAGFDQLLDVLDDLFRSIAGLSQDCPQ
jgi:hypothetical protein